MNTKVFIPTNLQKFTDNKTVIKSKKNNISELLDYLEQTFPGVKGRLRDDKGQPHRFLNIYINGEDIRFLEGIKSSIKDGDEISIIPAVAGG